MSIITDVPTIKKNIKTIGTARAKLSDLIQQAALAVTLHAHKHGDVTLASDLCVAVGNGMKHEALRVWLSTFGPMSPNADKDSAKTAPMVYAKSKRVEGEELEQRMADAAAVQWYSAPTEKSAVEWTLAGDIHKLLNKLAKLSESGTVLTAEEQAAAALIRQAGEKLPKPTKAVNLDLTPEH